MSGPNNYDYDNFDDSRDVREYRRRHRPAQPSGGGARRPPQSTRRAPGGGSSRSTRPQNGRYPRKRNNRRLRNRIIIVAFIIIIAAVLILILSSMFRGCSSKDDKLAAVSTETVASTSETAAEQSSTAQTASAQSSSEDLQPTYFTTPTIDDDNTEGTMSYSIYVWQSTGFEIFGSDDSRGQTYGETINTLAAKLDSDVKVYDMMVPNHTEMGLPQRLKDEAGSTSQADNIKAAYAALSDSVTPINCYNYLANHNTEYIYFKSDHHWTALGAYYAYKAFADTNGLSVLSLDDCTENKIEGFTGSFTNTASGMDEDTVSYYTLPYTVSMEVTSSSGDTVTYESPYYPLAEAGSNTYGVFIVGDNPLTVLKSSSEAASEGKKIAVIKESYGNALVPFLTYNYEEVHVVDFRYFKDSLNQSFVDYCKENSIDEVLFLNGVMSANTQTQLDYMTDMFG